MEEASRYRQLTKVGEGAFGAVFRARDRVSGADVALKRVRVQDVRQMPATAGVAEETQESPALRCPLAW